MKTQKLTDALGKATAYASNDAIMFFQVVHEDYLPVHYTISINDLDTTADDPLVIRMQEANWTGAPHFWTVLLDDYYNDTTKIRGLTYNSYGTQVKIRTLQMLLDGIDFEPIDCDNLNYCYFELTNGTYFDTTQPYNITLWVQQNNILEDTIIIPYIYRPKTNLFDIDLTSKFWAIMLFIMLIILCLVVANKFQQEYAYATFTIGSLFLAILNPTFIFMGSIGVIYYALKAIRKVTTE